MMKVCWLLVVLAACVVATLADTDSSPKEAQEVAPAAKNPGTRGLLYGLDDINTLYKKGTGGNREKYGKGMAREKYGKGMGGKKGGNGRKKYSMGAKGKGYGKGSPRPKERPPTYTVSPTASPTSLQTSACASFCNANLPNVASASCVNGVCVINCNEDYGDCNQDPTDGCEANFMDDANHCGLCGNDCGSSPCNNGLCANDFGCASTLLSEPTCEPFNIATCGGSGNCLCQITADGGSVCEVGFGNVGPCPNGQQDCPPGSVCIINTCEGNVCIPPSLFCSNADVGFAEQNKSGRWEPT